MVFHCEEKTLYTTKWILEKLILTHCICNQSKKKKGKISLNFELLVSN